MRFPTSTPSAEGVDPAALLALLDGLGSTPGVEPHGLIVHRHGRRILEGYWAPHVAGTKRLVYSLSKTFTGTALGLQLGEGRLALDDLVSDHLPDEFDDAVDERTRRMRIRHLASMSSGHDHETVVEASQVDPEHPVRGFLHLPPQAEPGTLFMYNQPPVLALATILQRLAGERLVDYLRPRLFEPLGIEGLRWAQAHPGVDLGYSGVFTDLDAVARLGQLYLDDGMWNGERLLPEGWVATASSVQTPNPERVEPDWQQGYGFQLWRSRHGYRGDGAFGQYMVVLPEHDTVVAFFSSTVDMQVVLDLLWEVLLPAMHDGPVDGDDAALAARVESLALPPAARDRGGAPVGAVSLRCEPAPPGTITHRTITSVELADRRLTVYEGERSITLPISEGWATSDDGDVATSATQLADGQVHVDLLFVHTPHRMAITLSPAEGTFTAVWRLVPLVGSGPARVTAMRVP
jgi:CubicO group peptidase (beta-lactamase class C family)